MVVSVVLIVFVQVVLLYTAIFCCFCCFFNAFFVRGDAGGAAAHPGGREIVTCGETS